MDELMIHFLMMQMVDQECVAKKQSQTNHINTNPSLNRKNKKPGISSAILCISLRMEDSFCFVKNVPIKNLEAMILYFLCF